MLTVPRSSNTLLLLITTAAVICSAPRTVRGADDSSVQPQATASRDLVDVKLMDAVLKRDDDAKRMAAVLKRDDNEIQALMDQGANIDFPRGDYGSFLLIGASASGQTEIVRFLVSRGAKVNSKAAFHGETPLTVAALNGHLDVVTFLIQHGADVNANCTKHGHSGYLVSEGIGPQNPSPLGSAAQEGQTEVVEYLIQKGAKVNGQDGSSYTPLMWACAASGNPETVKALLRHGADVTLKTDLGQTARNMALTRNDTRILALLDATTTHSWRLRPERER